MAIMDIGVAVQGMYALLVTMGVGFRVQEQRARARTQTTTSSDGGRSLTTMMPEKETPSCSVS
eukprot:2423503-Rhodomonas_salina.3